MSKEHHIRKFIDAEPGLSGPDESHEIQDIYFADLREVSKILSPADETALSRRVMRGHSASLRLSRDHLGPLEQQKLEKKVEDGHAARNALVVCNLRLVTCIARCYSGRGLPHMDLLQEGNLGLIEAAEDYDYRWGARFATFAVWDIRGAITRALTQQTRTIRHAEWFSDGLRFFGNVQGALYQEKGREPKVDELVDATGWTRESVGLALSAKPALDIDGIIKGSDGQRLLSDIVADRSAPSPEDTLIRDGDRLKEALYQMLDEIPPQYASVISRYYGLGIHEQQNLTKLGTRMGVTRAATSKRHKLGIEALRELAQSRNLLDP